MFKNEVGETFEGIVLISAHRGFDLTVKTGGNFISGETFCYAGGAAVRMVYGIASAFKIKTGAKRDLHCGSSFTVR